MRKIIYCILIALSTVSCNEWLDVQPDATVSEKELFKTQDGFFEAINGVYTRCAQADLYGGEFTVGFPDVMAQSYTNNIADYTRYTKTSIFDFTDTDFKKRKDAAWKAAYSAITNCNLILKNVDNQKSVFEKGNYEIVKGEALALRAYIHFDMLRLFGNSYYAGKNQPAIPYVTTYSNKVTKLSTTEEVLTKVIEDLNEAKTLLADNDPIIKVKYKVGYPDDTEATETTGNLFLQNRRHRLNYYAVCGALARAYLSKGDQVNALSNALIVINSTKFPWTKVEDFLQSDPKLKDRIMYNELVFGWYAQAQKTAILNRFTSTVSGQYISYDAARSLYEVASAGAEDYRFKAWFTQISTNYQIQKYLREDKDADNLHYLMMPGIRLSEMYYIAAEASYATNPAKAWEYLNTVRLHRGIGVQLPLNSSTDFSTELLKEYSKEMFAEGQVFYQYKRLNKNIVSQTNIIYNAGSDIYVVPLPDSEIEFSNR